MAADVLSLLTTALSASADIFSTVMEKSGMSGWFLAMVFIALSVRYLILPVLANRGQSGGGDD